MWFARAGTVLALRQVTSTPSSSLMVIKKSILTKKHQKDPIELSDQTSRSWVRSVNLNISSACQTADKWKMLNYHLFVEQLSFCLFWMVNSMRSTDRLSIPFYRSFFWCLYLVVLFAGLVYCADVLLFSLLCEFISVPCTALWTSCCCLVAHTQQIRLLSQVRFVI